jgi:CheY-like chemotaxis protein
MPEKRRLLVIDSSDSARTILFREISARAPDVDVIACASAKEAITAARRFEFNIITTGINLPDMDGYSLIEELRKTPKNRDTAIFVVSGDTQTRIIDDGAEDTRMVTAYFDKAEGHKSLVTFILNYLGSQNDDPIRVLYVDKSATSTAITASILKSNNIDFLHYPDAEDALEHLRGELESASGCRFDVMITDLMLSAQMTGFELIQAIRNDLNLDYLTLPILLMTIEPGEDEKTDFTGIFGAGTNDFITKPVDESALLERLDNLVNIKRQNEALNA